MDFKLQHNFEERLKESKRVLQKYPDRVPVICERMNKKLPMIDKNKYLVPSDLTMGQYIYVIRKRLRMPSEKAIFLFVNGVIPPTSTPLIELYEQYQDRDGFLYIHYGEENVFGWGNPGSPIPPS